MQNACSTCPIGLLCWSGRVSVFTRSSSGEMHFYSPAGFSVRVSDRCTQTHQIGWDTSKELNLMDPKDLALFRIELRQRYRGV